MGARKGEHAFIVDYEYKESQIPARAFHLEGVGFTPGGSLDELGILKTTLVTPDSKVNEQHRMLSATTAIGSKFGFKEQMACIQEREIFLFEQATAFDFASWRARLEPPANPPAGQAGQANIIQKARPRFEFGKFNFAGGFHRVRFHTLHISTTIYNVLFVSAVFELFSHV